jgi:Ca2+-binding EF-hand superfamily protein
VPTYITTQVVPPKIIREISPLDNLLNIFLDKMLTRCGGLNATRKAFKIFDIAGNGMITFDEFKKSINTMYIHSVDINTDIEEQLYDMLSVDHNGTRYITYSSFKCIIDADNDINKTYF